MSRSNSRVAVATIVLVPSAFLLDAVLVRAMVARPPGRLHAAYAQPLLVANRFGHFGQGPVLVLLATILGLGIALAFAFATNRTFALSYPRARALIVTASAVALAGAFTWPFTLSSDTVAYAAYGMQALSGLDPFTQAAQFARDPFTSAGRYFDYGAWPLCVYGPAFVLFCELVVRATIGLGPEATIAALRVCAIAAFLASAFVVSGLTRPLTPSQRMSALALYALNPLAIWAVAEGHNDIYALLLTLVGVSLVLHRRHFVGGLLVGLTPLVKLPFAVAALPLAIYLYGRGQRRAAATVAMGAAVGVALFAVWFIPRFEAERANASGGHHPSLALLASLVPAALVGCAVVALAVRALLRGDVRAFVWIGGVVFLAAITSYPWYAVWIVPLVAIPAGPLGIGIWFSTLAAAYRYFFEGTMPTTWHLSQINTIVKLLPPAIALGYLVAVARRRKRDEAIRAR
ncbi:MAG: hypothetical protein NVS2B8_08420 [Vulcanimicrobiaceae bacterium]